MIPASSKGYVEYVDEDGVAWRFKPRCGDTEDLLATYIMSRENDPAASVKSAREFVDTILLGWDDRQKKGMPDFPKNGHPGQLFTAEERRVILDYWHKANTLTIEEKKT